VTKFLTTSIDRMKLLDGRLPIVSWLVPLCMIPRPVRARWRAIRTVFQSAIVVQMITGAPVPADLRFALAASNCRRSRSCTCRLPQLACWLPRFAAYAGGLHLLRPPLALSRAFDGQWWTGVSISPASCMLPLEAANTSKTHQVWFWECLPLNRRQSFVNCELDVAGHAAIVSRWRASVSSGWLLRSNVALVSLLRIQPGKPGSLLAAL